MINATIDNNYRTLVNVTPTKQVESVTDWSAVAQNTIKLSDVIDCSAHYGTLLHLQAGLDTTTAHTGTRFLIQVSSGTAGNEDWQDYTEFVGLIGTASNGTITNNPLAAGGTVINTPSTTGFAAAGAWKFIKDATLANSELFMESGYVSNGSVTCVDGLTNAHVLNTQMYSIALSQPIVLDQSIYRARMVIDNSYDNDGSTLNYKLRASKITAI